MPNELANKMSLFYAHATPMLKVLSDATMRFVAENKDLPIENTTETLGTMAKVCQRMIENRYCLKRVFVILIKSKSNQVLKNFIHLC